ncbi:ABC transporter ATP-binding protein/permease [Clostridium estertheticum]|uniref:ABC transporter ATP-binding protein n=1 Tax=Clostridium estertheticum TaxID=238834 RepID=UPI001C6E12DA|nr:ABC transporter ATP-binding protein [Clostridium estertheticum]MBW9170586.1 ABC transporter ATP-binding protein/permease [Clostridium estertheticum]WLC74963.1 ABC transporter ATP-binding protein/permease [Clostridium estertheticum]
MGYLKAYAHKYGIGFCIAVFFVILEAFCDLMQPMIMSKIVDTGVANKDLNYVIKMGIIMLIIAGFGAIFASIRNVMASNVSQKLGAELRSDLFKKIQGFSFENVDRFEGGTLVTRLTNDVTQVQNFINGLMRIFVKAPIVGIGSIIMATRLNLKLSMILFAIVPIAAILIYFNMKIGLPYFIKVQESLDSVNGVMREYLSGVRVVKAFNRFEYEIERFKDKNTLLTKSSTKAMKITSVFSPIIGLIVNVGIILVIWIGGLYVNKGSMHVGEIIAFTNYMTQILFSLMMVTNVFTMFVRARASTDRISEVFCEKNSMVNGKKIIDNSKDRGRVDFKHVYFSYNKDKEPILKDISFSCHQGETVGIIGSTGSGKSTLVNLIPRFYDVISGEIKVNGVNIKELDIKSLREKIAIVPQKALLFSGSILDNMKWGSEKASIDEIKEALKVAEAFDFIDKLPEGYNEKIGQGGVNFSGGQKQRISIARALVKGAEILILDDATSAVDTDTEVKIRNSLKKYSKDLTCILIAHRITSIMSADKIIVIDNGEIKAIGSHSELLKNCEIYNDIFLSQIGKEMI